MKKPFSIITGEKDRCFFCESQSWIEWHHVFGGALRDKSTKYGLVVPLCRYCHNEPPNGVHQNREIRLKLQAYAQRKAMEQYGWDTERFIKEFYKNYL